MEESVRQGFICPFCMLDCGDFENICLHVEEHHPDDADEDLAENVLKNVKGFFGKAKRGLLEAKMSIGDIGNLEIINSSASASDVNNVKASSSSSEKLPPARKPKPMRVYNSPPPLVTRSQNEAFRKYRDESINEVAIRTNMLIIRLDRLIHASPKDPVQRKEFERSVVPWLDDCDTLFCPQCAAKFGLTRRRHHCRLCGKVLCHSCSKFLSFLSAKKLTNPAVAHDMLQSISESSALHSMKNDAEVAVSNNHRLKLMSLTRNSMDRMKDILGEAVTKVQSATSGDDLQEQKESLRVCEVCLRDLERREHMMENGKIPKLINQYNHLKSLTTDLRSLVQAYVRIANSLNNGETMYTLKVGEQMRQKCVEKQQEVDTLSKTIVNEYDENVDGLRIKQLRNNIRTATLQNLQLLIGQTRSLPTEEEYKDLVEKYKQDISRQIARERARMSQNSNNTLKQSLSEPQMNTGQSSSQSVALQMNSNEGWAPQQIKSTNPFSDDLQHPLLEQREIIKSMLLQAVSAGRLEEVESLECNLKELEEEMKIQGLDS